MIKQFRFSFTRLIFLLFLVVVVYFYIKNLCIEQKMNVEYSAFILDDSSKKPIIHAFIHTLGSTNVTTSDSGGFFKLSDEPINEIVIFKDSTFRDTLLTKYRHPEGQIYRLFVGESIYLTNRLYNK